MSGLTALAAAAALVRASVVDHRWTFLAGGFACAVVAAALLASATARRGRRAVAFAVVGTVLAAGLALAALGHHAALNGEHGDIAERMPVAVLRGWEESDRVVTVVGWETVATIDLDGHEHGETRLEHSLRGIGRGRAAFSTGWDGELIVYASDGTESWRREFSAGGEPAENTGDAELVAALADGSGAVLACGDPGRRCEIIGVGPDGEERWRQPVAGRRVVPGPTLDPLGNDATTAIPQQLVVLDDADSDDPTANGPVHTIDLATGASTALTTGTSAVVGDGFVAVTRTTNEGCEVELYRQLERHDVVPVPCVDGSLPYPEVVGTTVAFIDRDRGLTTVVDVASGDPVAGTVAVSEHSVVADAGAVLDYVDGRWRLIRGSDGRQLRVVDAGWSIEAVGPGSVVLKRSVTTGNPLLGRDYYDVQVIDPATGRTCAEARVAGEGPLGVAPLSDCRALVGPGTDTSYLIGE